MARRIVNISVLGKEADGLVLNDEVTVVLKGRIKALEAPYEPEKGEKKENYVYHREGNINIQMTGLEIKKANEFAELAKA